MSSNAEFEEFYGGAVGRLLGQLLLVTGDLHLLAALRTLPIRQRQVLVLHHLVGVPVEEVARTLSLPSGTVKSALARGRRALAVLLDDLEEVPGP